MTSCLDSAFALRRYGRRGKCGKCGKCGKLGSGVRGLNLLSSFSLRIYNSLILVLMSNFRRPFP